MAVPFIPVSVITFDPYPKAFNPIGGMKYAETCFHNPNQANCWPNAPDEDPDDDAYEN